MDKPFIWRTSWFIGFVISAFILHYYWQNVDGFFTWHFYTMVGLFILSVIMMAISDKMFEEKD